LPRAIRFILTTPAITAITLMFMGVNLAEGMLAVLLPVYRAMCSASMQLAMACSQRLRSGLLVGAWGRRYWLAVASRPLDRRGVPDGGGFRPAGHHARFPAAA